MPRRILVAPSLPRAFKALAGMPSLKLRAPRALPRSAPTLESLVVNLGDIPAGDMPPLLATISLTRNLLPPLVGKSVPVEIMNVNNNANNVKRTVAARRENRKRLLSSNSERFELKPNRQGSKESRESRESREGQESKGSRESSVTRVNCVRPNL
jgi:hypothetical protein